MAVTKTETTPSFAARKRLDPLRDGIDRQTERERERERERESERHTRQQSESEANYMCILLHAAYWGRALLAF